MRRLLLASVLFLSACATRPEQPAPTPQPVQPAPVQRRMTELAGLTGKELIEHLGRPALQIQEGTSIKLQFRTAYCVLDAYLYPGQSGVLRVTHVDTRTPFGVDVDQSRCISALEFPR